MYYAFMCAVSRKNGAFRLPALNVKVWREVRRSFHYHDTVPALVGLALSHTYLFLTYGHTYL